MLDTDKVREYRTRAGLSQAAAAKNAEMGGGRQQWSNIETGAKSDIALSTLDKMASALRVSPCKLLRKPGRPPKGK